ncbi:MAG: error-prone DNA polymerase [Pseudomonadota bacterium]
MSPPDINPPTAKELRAARRPPVGGGGGRAGRRQPGGGPPQATYAELQVTSNFSFLRGGAHPDELMAAAHARGLSAIAVTDRNTLAGVVRAHTAAKEIGIRLLVGCRLDLLDGPSLLVWPRDRAAYGRLSRLLSAGKMRAPKGECHLTLAETLDHLAGHEVAVIPPETPTPAFQQTLRALAHRLTGLHLAASHRYQGQDRARIGQLAALARATGTRLLATNDVHYHLPERRPLQDVLTCIREGVTIHEAGHLLAANAERHVKDPAEMARLFRGHEDALHAGLTIAQACTFSLDELAYEYPDEPVPPGKTPQSHLEDLTWAGAQARYPDGVPPEVSDNIARELALIAELGYAPYFLTVHDIVDYARTPQPDKGRLDPILCQGRGSAANSSVCYCLGITSVDPARIDLLFERFITRERREPPDIDVDFEHERREEVIQYIYDRYGRHRAGLAATVICYRPRSAVREVGKAMGLTEDVTAALAGTVWGAWGKEVEKDRVRGAGLDPDDALLARVIALTDELIGFPRHLSQHVGGFVLTRGPLIETVPIGNAAMDERTFIEWDKDDIDALGILKVDVLALGMLSCIRRAFDMLEDHFGIRHDLASIPADDPGVFGMIGRADTLGVFQIESRAQMSMLPRLKPTCFYDLVIEVAIVRPGPIQGDMVHPYLRRRKGLEAVEYPAPDPAHGPADELERILGRTLGVPLFQEQAMKIAMQAAQFTPGELNELRRALATFRKRGTIGELEERMVTRMVARGYTEDFARRCFGQIKGFGTYGFPESHAASFALLVWVSCWLKHHYPEVFCAALLNAQPMGFYAPAQIVRDARAHGVEVRDVDINRSDWDCRLEGASAPAEACGWVGGGTAPPGQMAARHQNRSRRPAVRLGLRQVDGVGEAAMARLVAHRPYRRVSELQTRAGLNVGEIEHLAEADAFRSIGLNRRQALWEVRALRRSSALPLFAQADALEYGDEPKAALPAMAEAEHVIADYRTLKMSLRAHPLSFLRAELGRQRVVTSQTLWQMANNTPASVAGVVLVRQRPGTAKGVCFMTLEDEEGVANVIVWPKVLERFRAVVMGARLVQVVGRVQQAEGVLHLVAHRLIDRSTLLDSLADQQMEAPLARADEVVRPIPEAPQGRRHPRDIRILPKSRDFH